MLLDGKKVLVTGVLHESSIAFSVARPGPGAGRRDRAHVVRAGHEPHQAHRPPAADRARRARARRHRPGPPALPHRGPRPAGGAGSTASCTRSPSPPPTAWAATSCRPSGTTCATALHVSAYSLKALAGAVLPLHAGGRRGLDRRPRLRRPPGLARLRLDGRGQGRPGGHVALPGPRPGPRPGPGQPGVRRPAAHDRGQGHPRVRADRGDVGRPGAARLGHPRRRAGGQGVRGPAVRLVPGHHRRDGPRRRRLPLAGGGGGARPDRPDPPEA